MNNIKIIETYLIIDKFFTTFKLIKPLNKKEMDDTIIKLFYHPEFGNDKTKNNN
jgi:hypothetical protein